jgi:hypothetical protein
MSNGARNHLENKSKYLNSFIYLLFGYLLEKKVKDLKIPKLISLKNESLQQSEETKQQVFHSKIIKIELNFILVRTRTTKIFRINVDRY